MCRLIDEIAKKKGIDRDDANYIFVSAMNILMNNIPDIKQIIEDIFENPEAGELKNHISKMILSLQNRQYKEEFSKWQIPVQEVIKKKGCDLIL